MPLTTSTGIFGRIAAGSGLGSDCGGSGTVTVELQGSLDRLDVETGSGDVAITAPANLSADLVMDTASGDIDTDFPLAVTRTARDHLRGRVGDGKGKISVETGSGGIRLLKGK